MSSVSTLGIDEYIAHSNQAPAATKPEAKTKSRIDSNKSASVSIPSARTDTFPNDLPTAPSQEAVPIQPIVAKTSMAAPILRTEEESRLDQDSIPIGFRNTNRPKGNLREGDSSSEAHIPRTRASSHLPCATCHGTRRITARIHPSLPSCMGSGCVSMAQRHPRSSSSRSFDLGRSWKAPSQRLSHGIEGNRSH